MNYPVERLSSSAGHSVNDDERLSHDNNLGGNADFKFVPDGLGPLGTFLGY